MSDDHTTPTELEVRVRRFRSWSEIVDAAQRLTVGWVFRGHNCVDWNLKTTIEREFGDAAARGQHELAMLHHFRTRAPSWLQPHLVPKDDVGWLGLIQHYGGVTRLLDVTRSPYVALFLAFEKPGEHDRAVWAISDFWCSDRCDHAIAEHEKISVDAAKSRRVLHDSELVSRFIWGGYGVYLELLREGEIDCVLPMEPAMPDTRQVAQQALFLCPSNVRKSFIDNMAAMGPPPVTRPIYKLVIPGALREEVIEQLRLMNLSAATLFPGIDGLGRSLRTIVVRPPFDNQAILEALGAEPLSLREAVPELTAIDISSHVTEETPRPREAGDK